MRIVIDTNIVVAAVLTPDGPASRVFDEALRGTRVQALYDERIAAEYEGVLLRPASGSAPMTCES